MASQRSIDKALAALHELLAEGLNAYPEDEQRIRDAIVTIQRLPRRG